MPGHTGEVPVIDPGVTGGGGFTVMATPLLVAVAGVAQIAFDVSITLTTSPFAKLVVLKFGLLVPTLLPLICHW